MKALQMCSKGHQEICYAGAICPMCELKTMIMNVVNQVPVPAEPVKTNGGGIGVKDLEDIQSSMKET